jgi:L-aminopeptidase/D-esterase-like protein
VRVTPAVAIVLGSLAAAGSVGSRSAQQSPASPPGANHTLTAVGGIKVGHVTLSERPTGCTVVLAEGGATAGVDVRGAAPGTRETDLLSPVNLVEKVHAIVFAGGSAFGLDAASGVVRWLEEHRIGFDVGVARVPIVPAAILFDLRVGDARIRPTADCGYRAAAIASAQPVEEGNVGAGAGATLGHARGPTHAMKSGIGSAAVSAADGLLVAALAAVNPYGDVIDPATGQLIAGARADDGRSLADVRKLLRGGKLQGRFGENTILVVVATNARLTKTQATKAAQMAHDGIARAVWPVHTPMDGDTAFALATGTLSQPVDLLRVGALAADVTAEAILRAVRSARGLPGLPAVGDLARPR